MLLPIIDFFHNGLIVWGYMPYQQNFEHMTVATMA